HHFLPQTPTCAAAGSAQLFFMKLENLRIFSLFKYQIK
ncbi:MAG: hypothetical protein ACI9JY_002979, partial [Saprospiraceae bacterium]